MPLIPFPVLPSRPLKVDDSCELRYYSGDQGVRAVMLVPLLAGNRVKVSATGCNISIKDANCWFNFDKLVQDYTLDLTDGFSRAVAIILLHLIAGHPT